MKDELNQDRPQSFKQGGKHMWGVEQSRFVKNCQGLLHGIMKQSFVCTHCAVEYKRSCSHCIEFLGGGICSSSLRGRVPSTEASLYTAPLSLVPLMDWQNLPKGVVKLNNDLTGKEAALDVNLYCKVTAVCKGPDQRW